MRFAVGYQLAEAGEPSFVEIVRDFREQIAEVYFPWADMPSGRASLATRRGYTNWRCQAQLEADLTALREMGVRLDLLFNANCYGGKALSRFLQQKVFSLLDHLRDSVGGVDTVTTTSLAVARAVKECAPETEVRASVNMRIGTVAGMDYVADIFDAFYVQRDFNRDLGHIRRLKRWSDAHEKKLYLLANSGCLAFCSGQIFHDNLVSHEQEIDETLNVPGWSPTVCWDYYRHRANWPAMLQSTWIRPEDMYHYEDIFPVVKLATRMHQRPRAVIQAYVDRRWHGNLLDLFEPGFSPAFAPFILDNDRFPEDWFQRTSTCRHDCELCGYCRETLDRVLVSMTA